MALVDINWDPPTKILKRFGWVAWVAFGGLGYLMHYKYEFSWSWSFIAFGIGVVVLLSSFVCLKLTRYIFVGLTLITLPIGLVINFIFLSLFYFAILFPLGLFFRIIGRDALHLVRRPEEASYWVARNQPKDKRSYFRQF